MASIQKLKSGHTVEYLGEDDFKRLGKNFPIFDGYFKAQPGNWFFSSTIEPILKMIYDFEFRKSDTIVMSYPKSGTTWMQEIVWTLSHNPDLNNPEENTSIDIRSPHLECDFLLASKKAPKLNDDSVLIKLLKAKAPEKAGSKFPIFHWTEAMDNPRVIKSHLPLEIFPPSMLENAKVVYVLRDPRDVITSKYHFWQLSTPYSFQGSLDEFIDNFLAEEQFNHPYWPHVKKAYDLRDHPNIHLVYFEELKADPFKEIKRIAEFLGLNRSDKQIQNVVEFTNFKNMKKRSEDGTTDTPMTDGGRFVNDIPELGKTGFFRKGTSGSWRDNFDEDQVKKITKWMDENIKLFPDDFKYKKY